MKPHVIKLAEPIKVGEDTITELTFRKPKAKDLRSLPAEPKTGDLLDLAGSLAGEFDHVIDELSIPDAMKVLELMGELFGSGHATGPK